MSLPRRFKETIDTLYHVFEPFSPLGSKKTREQYDDIDADLPDAWFKISPRFIAAEELGRFYSQAMTTFGNEDFFRWILPRVFELTIVKEDSSFDPGLLGMKLTYGDWLSWPARQRDTIRSSISHVWESFIEGAFHRREVDDWLGLIESSKLPLAPYLDHWDIVFETNKMAQRHFIDLLVSVIPSLQKGKAICFFGDEQYQIQGFRDWFLDTRKIEILESSMTIGREMKDRDNSYSSYFEAYRNMVNAYLDR